MPGMETNPTPGATAADNNGGDQPSTQRNKGLGRVIIAVYAVFAIAALARSGFQIATKFDEAPLPYTLSAISAIVYLIATFALARPGKTAWTVAMVAVVIEAVGVISVGVWSLVSPEMFPDSSVWSHFGQGYGYVPLVLPFIGGAWLLTHRPGSEDQASLKVTYDEHGQPVTSHSEHKLSD